MTGNEQSPTVSGPAGASAAHPVALQPPYLAVLAPCHFGRIRHLRQKMLQCYTLCRYP